MLAPPTGLTTSLITMNPLSNEHGPYLGSEWKVNLEAYPKTLHTDCSETTWQLDRKSSTFVARYGAADDTLSFGEQWNSGWLALRIDRRHGRR
ncbi:hypothetical protein ABT024_20605 [Streptomyces sp. NPDC002812]|uniref:hypothetical protein n=1 Tax=Streptomyces sp. NPDC002812 TaxID=3154434 RepID=UPI0033276AEA